MKPRLMVLHIIKYTHVYMRFTKRDALLFLKVLSLSLKTLPFEISELVKGLNVELEHGTINPLTNVTNDNLILTGKIALAHLLEDSEYYKKLAMIEK